MEPLYIGVDLGGTKIYTAIANERGKILNEEVVPTEASKGPEQIIEKMISSIKKVSTGINLDRIKAIGIGSPGPLDVKNGLIVSPPNLPIRNFNVVEAIKNEFQIPTFLDNDANAATLGEYIFGAGKGCENMVYITASTGVGGGAILNGKLYRGSTSNALEVGHSTVDRNGRACGCGNRGCVESMSSGIYIEKMARDSVSSGMETTLSKYETVTAKEVFTEATNGDAVANQILSETLSYLGIAVANCANIFDPDKIVIGGGVTNGGPIVFEKINEEMNARCLAPIRENCKIEKAQLGGKAGVVGAIALALVEYQALN
ncbi:MAG: ROK family protein [Turicibacter sanguinis]|uniref:ROK family protein n=1 Tax=Turicibacter sanguinis TaxID=154288 RepID=UPI002F94B2C9